MNQDDLEYYLARIAAEEIAAQKATHPLAARSHQRLAEEYASLIVASNDGGAELPSKLVTHR